MSILLIQLPSQNLLSRATQNDSAQALPTSFVRDFPQLFCCYSRDGEGVEYEGWANESQIKHYAQQAKQTILIFPSHDVRTLQVKVPPVPANKIQAMLPHLVEEQLLGDMQDQLIVSHTIYAGVCTLSIFSQSWVRTVFEWAQHLGAQKIVAIQNADVLAESSLALVDDVYQTACLHVFGKGSDRLNMGILLQSLRHEGDDASRGSFFTHALEQASFLFASDEPLNLYVNEQHRTLVQQVKKTHNSEPQYASLQCYALDWHHYLNYFQKNTSTHSTRHLFSDLQKNKGGQVDWTRWRWTLIWSLSLMILLSLGLYWKWWSLKRESDLLRQSINQSFTSLFPKEPLRDPIVQMEQKYHQLQKLSGQSSPDDYLVLSAQFAQVWEKYAEGKLAIKEVEYRDQSLWVKPHSMTEISIEVLRQDLSAKQILIEQKEDTFKVSYMNALNAKPASYEVKK